jgi:hypothetical protein
MIALGMGWVNECEAIPDADDRLTRNGFGLRIRYLMNPS